MRRLGWSVILFACLALQACLPAPTGTPTEEHIFPETPPFEATFTLPPLPGPTVTQRAETPRPVRPAAPTGTPRPIPTAGETGLAAVHRSGQTFLTWGELPGGSYGERYRVYRSSQPINRDNLPDAKLLAELPAGSANFLAGRMTDPATGNWGQRFFLRLTAGGASGEVPAGQGLFVWTPNRDDLGERAEGSGYYAVTIRLPDGGEILPSGYASGAVYEAVADPLPVETGPLLGDGTHVMLQYMDLHTWNPTFHAPNALNDYYGLDRSDPEVSGAIQYAYDYVIYDPVCPDRRDPVPVVLVLQGGPPVIRPELASACAYKIIPLDTGSTGWFGFSQTQDYRQKVALRRGMPVANFTEQRILRMVYDLLRDPAGSVAADPRRVYVVGTGSGASGALALALRYPNVFAAAYLNEPVSDYSALSAAEMRHYFRLWGERGLELPIILRAPAGWSAVLQQYAGTPVWRWQNLNRGLSLLSMTAAPLGISATVESERASWGDQITPVFTALNNGHQSWGGWIAAPDAEIPQWGGLPPNLLPDSRGQPFFGFNVVRDETVPGMSGGELSGSIPPRGAAVYNQTILWSASWLRWDGVPVDQPGRWEMSLCAVSQAEPRACGSGDAQRVNITPRRVQRFAIVPGQVYVWESRRIRDGSVIDSGTLTATNDGLITVRNLLIYPDGIRLIIVPAGGNLQR